MYNNLNPNILRHLEARDRFLKGNVMAVLPPESKLTF